MGASTERTPEGAAPAPRSISQRGAIAQSFAVYTAAAVIGVTPVGYAAFRTWQAAAIAAVAPQAERVLAPADEMSGVGS